MNYMGFDEEIGPLVAAVLRRKLRRKARAAWSKRLRRHPRFHMTTTLQLCARQRVGKLQTAGGW